ncbi:hypothetical protein AVEN_122318-1 [Araneus ventricosus]|uniref:Uncharacterized protein n=1 Tax=Araneus ventricosus TaxID=182803 RepID=A0A4Y2U6E1_ARAVE|nr:hypothetical protein AVEN_122318-1 [Araneus ventricosus]
MAVYYLEQLCNLSIFSENNSRPDHYQSQTENPFLCHAKISGHEYGFDPLPPKQMSPSVFLKFTGTKGRSTLAYISSSRENKTASRAFEPVLLARKEKMGAIQQNEKDPSKFMGVNN